MNVFLQRSVPLLIFIVLQRSFLDVLWPSLEAPSLLIATIISLVFLLGFKQSLGWVLFTVLLFMLLGTVGYFAIFAVVVAYGTSFLSRRLLIERRLQSILALSVVSAGSAVAYLFISFFWYRGGLVIWQITGNALEALLIFPIVFGILRFSEEHIRASLMSEFRGLRSRGLHRVARAGRWRR